jgi:hypothetical protein
VASWIAVCARPGGIIHKQRGRQTLRPTEADICLREQAAWLWRQVNNPYARRAAVLFELAAKMQEQRLADEKIAE